VQKHDNRTVKCTATLFVNETTLFGAFLVKIDFFSAFSDQITCQMLETSLKSDRHGQNFDAQHSPHRKISASARRSACGPVLQFSFRSGLAAGG